LLGAGGVASALALAPIAAQAQPASSSADDTWATPWAQKVPDSLLATHVTNNGGTPACELPDGRGSTYVHCYAPDQIREAYGVPGSLADVANDVADGGAGQTIVLVDSYGSPTAIKDVDTFAKRFDGPTPNVDQVFPLGDPGFLSGSGSWSGHGQGWSGPGSAEGWAGEANLDVQWAYAIAPKAHIVLVATPVAETQGVQGLPNMMKAIDWAIKKYPSGTVFSMSLGTDESAFPGNSASSTFAKFDQTFKRGLAKGDTFFASSGDSGTVGSTKAHHASATSPDPQVSYPNVSPYVTSVGGTQLQDGWTWNPTGLDKPWTDTGDYNPDYWASTTTSGSSEAVGDEPAFEFGTGGGLSHVYPRPAFQDSVKDVVGNHRGVPDLSWNMALNGGVMVYTSFFPKTDGKAWHIYGGTSASSPQVAALTALANEARASMNKAPVGNLNQVIYSRSFDQGTAFNDIVTKTYGDVPSGVRDNNRMWTLDADGILQPGPVPGMPTTSGYDLTTGWGSPHAGAFIQQLTDAK
ncbi:MAG TPA: S53 family peptidase, partial [Segeticoccus sp.]|uniref:S53 family peptidase n=1 Tax=Segeticoccus sp. TaxID=2706531 RepID=UPI002D7EC55A